MPPIRTPSIARLLLLAGCGVLPAAIPAAAQEIPLGGCTLAAASKVESAGGRGEVRFPEGTTLSLIESTGDPVLDRSLHPLAFNLMKHFGLDDGAPPAVFLVADVPEDPVIYALDMRLLEGTDGAILIGKHFALSELRGSPFGGAAIAGILAHEFAHIFQYRTAYWQELLESDPQGTVSRAELHADFLAGWYVARADFVTSGGDDELVVISPEGNDPSSSIVVERPNRADFISLDGIDAFATSLFEKGDTDFTEEDHHGTFAQRYAAMLKGYFVGRNSDVSLEEAARIGADFVIALI